MVKSSYSVRFTKSALKSIKKLDAHESSLITSWLMKNIEGCGDPRAFGKALAANKAGQWRYRVGDYRLIAEIDDGKVIVLILTVGHRRDIYR